MELLECQSTRYDHIKYDENGKVDVPAMIADGWKFETIPWTYEYVYLSFLNMVEDNEYIVLTKNSIMENNSVSSTRKIRGNLLISKQGRQNFVKRMNELAEKTSQDYRVSSWD